jgi:hypothetical protein
MRRGIQVLMQDAQSGKFDLVLKETAFPASRKTSQGLQAPALCRRKDYTLSEGEIRNKESCHEVRAPKVPLPRGRTGISACGELSSLRCLERQRSMALSH